ARANRVNPRVVAANGDLGANTRVASRTENLNQSLPDFGHFQLEQLDQELGRGPRQEQLRPSGLGAHFLEESFDPVLRLHLLTGNHIGAGNEALGIAAKVDVDTVAVHALHDTADERSYTVLVGIDDLLALSLADLLNDDLLCLLGGDTPESHGFNRLLDE